MPIDMIVINTEENDDWMKSLPGYQDEVEITENALKPRPTLRSSGPATVKEKRTKAQHFQELQSKPKLVDAPKGTEEGSDAWFHFDALYDGENEA